MLTQAEFDAVVKEFGDVFGLLTDDVPNQTQVVGLMTEAMQAVMAGNSIGKLPTKDLKLKATAAVLLTIGGNMLKGDVVA